MKVILRSTVSLFCGLLVGGCAVAGGARARSANQISVVVTAADGVGAGAAQRMRAIVETSIRRTVHGSQPLLVSIALTPRTLRHESPGASTNKQGASFLQVTEADYALTDADGFVLDARSIAIPTAEVGYSRLDPMHVAAETIASRIALLQR